MDLDPVARDGLRRLGASFALLWVATSMSAGPGPAAWIVLSGQRADAGLYFALFSLSAAAGAALGGRAMDSWGRKPVLAAGLLLAAAGYALAGGAIGVGSLGLFAAGVAALAFGTGGVYLTRVAAAELVAPPLRGRATARVMASATVGAVAGPLLLVVGGPLGRTLGMDPFALVWWVAPPLLLLAAWLVHGGPEPRDVALRRGPEDPPAAAGLPAGAAPGVRPVLAAVAALVAAQAAMVAVMGVAGAAVTGDGHGAEAVGVVMALHFVGMFGLAPLVGRVADRAGRRATILAGLGTLAVGGLAVAALPGPLGLGAGLLVIGVGWSFAYLGGSVLLTDAVPLARRARVVGRTDLVASLCAAAAAAAGGAWFASHGLGSLGVAAAAIAALPVVLVLGAREPALRAAAPGTPGDPPTVAQQD